MDFSGCGWVFASRKLLWACYALIQMVHGNSTSTRQRAQGGFASSMAPRMLLRMRRVSLSGQSWQIWRRIQAVPGVSTLGNVSAAAAAVQG